MAVAFTRLANCKKSRDLPLVGGKEIVGTSKKSSSVISGRVLQNIKWESYLLIIN